MFKLLVLAGLVCLTQASVIAQKERLEASPKEADLDYVDEWVREFYDKCGQTEAASRGQIGAVGTYRSEVVKRCIGDRPTCVAERNCYFAVAIKESAYYKQNVNNTGFFESFERVVTSHNVQLLDTCHKPSTSHEIGNSTKVEKFVGLTVGVFNATTKKPVCDAVPTIDDFKAYFILSNFTECDVQTDIPVYPEFQQAPSGGLGPISTITNEISLDYSTGNEWTTLCEGVEPTLPTNYDSTKSSEVLKYFLVHYYGTSAFTLPTDFTFADTDVEAKTNIVLKPAKEEDRVPADENQQNGGISFKPSSAFVSATLVLSLLKSFF